MHPIANELTVKWGTSRGRDTYGYTTCNLYENGRRIAGCNGGGYDMRGTVFGHWLAMRYRDRLLELRPEDMPARSHWQPDDLAMICYECDGPMERYDDIEIPGRHRARLAKWDDERPKCPGCGETMTREQGAGSRVEDGRYLYGLTFHDPDYDPGNAIIGQDCIDATFGNGEFAGKTVREAEKAGASFGLERIRAVYKASSKHPTSRHTVPSIDGACGFSSVTDIAKAIGLDVELISMGSRRSPDLIRVRDTRARAAA